MTPKEKAKELFKKQYQLIWNIDWGLNVDKDAERYEAAKKCALIAIDEMFEEISKWAGGEFQEWEKLRWKYLQEVKQEIEKL